MAHAGGTADPPLCLPEAENTSHVKGILPAPGGKRTPLSRDREFEAETPVETNLVTFLTDHPKPKLCLDSSPVEHPKPICLCPMNSSHIYPCLKSIKAACFGRFLGPMPTRPPCAQIKMCFFSSCSFVVCQFYYCVKFITILYN